MSAAVDEKVIAAVAKREGWRVQEVETGLFRVIKLWIDEVVLVEFLTEEENRRYAAAFSASGLPALDDRLRDLEAGLVKALAAKLRAEQLAAILGQPV